RWPRDAGLRIDFLLLSKESAKRLQAAAVDRAVRGKPNASDHAPVWIELKDKPLRSRNSTRSGKRMPLPQPSPASGGGSPRARRERRPLLVIDGDSFTHRSYHALPKNIMRKGDKPAG